MADERLPGPADPDGDQQDLADRMALTRVPGMSTELQDESEVEYRSLRLERVVLISVWTTGTADDARNAMIELKALAETAGSQVLEGLVQRRSRPDAATYLGAGKVDELREVVVATGADIADARERAYAHIARIDFTDGFARSDIASQARLDAIAARLG